jgi:uncharacterized protein
MQQRIFHKEEWNMFRMTPKEGRFFDLFVNTANDTCKAAKMLEELMTDYTDVDEKIAQIEKIEHQCDNHVHNMIEQLNRSFITPIDREDIFQISKELDNITDAIEGTAHRFKMFNVKYIHEDAIKLVRMVTSCTIELRNVMAELKTMKRSKVLSVKIIEVNRIEDEGDNIYRNAITKLFIDEKDALEVIKWREIYEFLENTLDACEDVANIVEGIVMKHA